MWIEETWCGFARGCELAVALPGQWKDIGRLVQVWEERKVSVITAVPTLMAMVCNESSLPSNVRIVNVGGEACPASLVDKLYRSNLEIYNTYGPTETTVTCTYTKLYPNHTVTIGKPLRLYHAALLAVSDDNTENHNDKPPVELLLPVEGATGELAIGGPCVGQGYVGLPQLTKDKFITYLNERLYRTGDLVTIDGDGNIVYIGRIDTQVKYRGYRIELGEIEEKLSGLDGVVAAAVIFNQEEPQSLEAYVVLNKPLRPGDLRKALSETSLMSYMLPDEFITLQPDEMPRLLSGKIDKKKLQSMSSDRRQQEKLQVNNMDEATMTFNSSLDFIMYVWHNQFCQENITPDMDIFTDLVAHSMLVAQCVSVLRAGHENVKVNPFSSIGLVDLYTLRTGAAIAKKYPMISSLRSQKSYTHPAFHRVPFWRHFICGLMQIPLLLVIFFLYGVNILMPFIVSEYYYHKHSSFYMGFIALYVSYVIVTYFTIIVALIAKWIFIGQAKAGTYPLWGWFYLRWWFVGRVMSLVDMNMLNDTTWMNMWWRLLGAKIGQHVRMDNLNLVCAHLISIGDNTTLVGVDLVTEYVDHGMLYVGPIAIGKNCYIGTSCAIEASSVIKDNAELLSMTGVSEGSVIPECEVHGGSPAMFVRKADPWSLHDIPSRSRFFVIHTMQWLGYTFVMPFLNALLVAPIIVLFNNPLVPVTDDAFTQMISVASIAGVAYVCAVAVELVFFKWVLLGKVQPGTYSTYSWFALRKWFVDALMDKSFETIHSLYATVYFSVFMRILGAKIGSRTEISTARNMTPDLIDIGNQCFIADNVLLDESRGYIMKLDKTTIKDRTFIGNDALVPQGVTLPGDCLVGAFSTPLENIQSGQSCFGLPPILMPSRPKDKTFDTKLLYDPSLARRLCRFTFETIRVWLPPALICLGIGVSTQLMLNAYPLYVNKAPGFLDLDTFRVRKQTKNTTFHTTRGHSSVDLFDENIVDLTLMSTFYYICIMVLPPLLLLFVLKWLFIGKYKLCVLPMYSYGVWSSELLTGVFEHLVPFALEPFVGTPFLPWIYILFGSSIGDRCFMGCVDISEFDMLFGDDVAINNASFPQTHLFEDRIMKIGRTKLGVRSTMRAFSTLFPDSEIGCDVTLGCFRVVMKGECLLSSNLWVGFSTSIT
ncbi:peptide synthetase [Thraustotheca clavata]|uniref:Peptide synthetase n=1 Tax=Thraustotheca clavata TaxID=74557 RepID=A0A1V9YT53_9STRA|nr:peptide synthetase [Thraustotheca clavata]